MITLTTIAILTPWRDTGNRSLVLNILKVTSVRYHALRAREWARAIRPNQAPTNTNIVGCETDFNILCRKFFINISESQANRQKV